MTIVTPGYREAAERRRVRPSSRGMCVGNLCLVQWLVNEAGADVMATDEHGRNVPMKTVDLNIVQWLVENGGLDLSF